ncbi:MAG: hypothetical protein ABIP93_05715 [Gemmatimonadaceae bacterium]
MLGVVQAIYAKARFGEEMRVTPLAARHIEDARPARQCEELDEPRDFLPVASEIEDGLILEQVVGVEVRFPPLFRLPGRRQKKTGSR